LIGIVDLFAIERDRLTVWSANILDRPREVRIPPVPEANLVERNRQVRAIAEPARHRRDVALDDGVVERR
jgi:hypothetical protein